MLVVIKGFMVDISDPGDNDYTGTTVIPPEYKDLERGFVFYMGGNTPHVWTPTQVRNQTNRYALPLWTYDPTRKGYTYGYRDGVKAAGLARDTYGIPAGQGYLIGLDMETWVDFEYSRGFRDGVVHSSYWYTDYGSRSSVGSNYQGELGPFTASWNNVPHIDLGAWATQYANSKMTGHPFDISCVSTWAHCWDTQAHVTQTLMVTVKSVDGGKTWSVV